LIYMGIIYQATNKINGMKYIGATTLSLEERKSRHLSASRSKKDKPLRYFHAAIRKYGWENFSWEILGEEPSENSLRESESNFITYLDTIYPNGYNMVEKATWGPLSEEDKVRISRRRRRVDYSGIVFVSPEGVEYRNIENMKKFSKDHGIKAKISSLLRKSTKGKSKREYNNWKIYRELPDGSIENISPSGEFRIRNS